MAAPPAPPTSAPPAAIGRRPGAVAVAVTSPRRRWLDHLGRWAVTFGGVTIIAGILGILVFILVEIWPLLVGARVNVAAVLPWRLGHGAAVVGDERRSEALALTPDGRRHILGLADGAREDLPLPPWPGGETAADKALPLSEIVVCPSGPSFVAATRDGQVFVGPVHWDARDPAEPRTGAAVGAASLLLLDPAGRPLGAFTGAAAEDGGAVAAARLADGSMALVRRRVETNAITGATSESVERRTLTAPRPVDHLLIDAAGHQLYGGTATGELIYWPISDAGPGQPVVVSAGSSAITALSFLIGSRALVVGQANGDISVWFLVHQPDGGWRPTRIRDFPRRRAPIRLIAPSPRDKGFLVQDEGGELGLYYSTSHRTLWTGRSPVPDASSLFFSPKADGAVIAGADRIASLAIHNPHPEISLQALFGRVWYEGYDKPQLVWQSSGATDDFEPKLSLTPLLFGTLKGTIYSLFLAIPLGVLGAMYASQFMHASLRKYVKPTIEIMAALPSVVLGFLAGLWLAPRVERFFPALLLMLLVLPLSAVACSGLWRALGVRLRRRPPAGAEALLGIGFLALGGWLCLQLNGFLERALFGGRFPSWLLAATGLTYDQRNAVVVGLAMGFAVIPIIFSVSEEAFSNVPRGLVAGSLALGATRWQTVTRVVLPSASPGIFSAIMIGFGRAVGETMIVLMATGNTPIMDWSPFNGFRTLSANIAVEIPEAPHGGTLFRTLFLAGLLLFALTFAVNTAAEVVRQNLRRRYQGL